MNRREEYREKELTETIPVIQTDCSGNAKERSVCLLSEHTLKVSINGCLTWEIVCVAQYLTELVLGRLLSEQRIQGMEDVKSICICESGERADVMIKDRERKFSCLQASPIVPIEWEPEWIFRLEEEFAMDTPLHRQTSSTHSCFLAQRGETLVQCEDIGRHNAMDKVIGYGLRHGIDLRKSLVYSSGRVPTDMAVKAIHAGIPVLVSKESPTLEAVQLARQYGLTLLCNAKGGKFCQYTRF